MKEHKKIRIIEIIFVILTLLNFIVAFLGEDCVREWSQVFGGKIFFISMFLFFIIGLIKKKDIEKNRIMTVLILIAHESIIMFTSILISCFCVSISSDEEITIIDRIVDLLRGSITFIPILIYFLVLIKLYFSNMRKHIETEEFNRMDLVKYIIMFTVIGICIGFSRTFVKALTGIHH